MSNFVYSFLQRVRIARNADHCNSTGCLSVRLFVRLSRSVFCPDEWRYDRAVFSIRWDNYSSFWRGKVYPDIRRESPQWGR